jgi:broad specificity phosphatase PhoE
MNGSINEISLVIIRHSKTDNTNARRPLSEEGVFLAKNLGLYLRNEKSFEFTDVFASGTERTSLTAQLVGGTPPTILSELDIPKGEIDLVLSLYAKYGDAPLQRYFSEGEKVKNLLLEYGRKAFNAIMKNRQGNCALVVGHGVLINAIAYVASQGKADEILDMKVEECEGFNLRYRCSCT